MRTTAVVFPGQGSQRKGMGLDFHDQFEESRHIFEIASEALSMDIVSICREGDSKLNLTAYTQPCILTAEIAMYEALRARFDFHADYFGGHSLGEYSALVASGVIPFEIAVRLTHIRGKLMQWSVPAGAGSMAAVIRVDAELPYDDIQELATQQNVDVANDNSPYQIVISGARAQVSNLCQKLLHRFGESTLRIVPLEISAPFHSRHMIEIESIFERVLESKSGDFVMTHADRVTSNFTGGFHFCSFPELRDALARQISGRVRWRENMAALREKADTIFELGPNRPLSGFFRSVGASVQSIIDLRTARRALQPRGNSNELLQ